MIKEEQRKGQKVRRNNRECLFRSESCTRRRYRKKVPNGWKITVSNFAFAKRPKNQITNKYILKYPKICVSTIKPSTLHKLWGSTFVLEKGHKVIVLNCFISRIVSFCIYLYHFLLHCPYRFYRALINN